MEPYRGISGFLKEFGAKLFDAFKEVALLFSFSSSSSSTSSRLAVHLQNRSAEISCYDKQ